MTTKRKAGRPRKTGYIPYKLLLIFLYGQMKWIEREGGTVRMPVVTAARHLKTTTTRLKEHLYMLENLGVLESVKWNKYWLTGVVRVPIDMARTVEPTALPTFEDIDVEIPETGDE